MDICVSCVSLVFRFLMNFQRRLSTFLIDFDRHGSLEHDLVPYICGPGKGSFLINEW